MANKIFSLFCKLTSCITVTTSVLFYHYVAEQTAPDQNANIGRVCNDGREDATYLAISETVEHSNQESLTGDTSHIRVKRVSTEKNCTSQLCVADL